MKCGEMTTLSLARAYKAALEEGKGDEVKMDRLAPHLAKEGSGCGACPVLLPMAKKAFEDMKDNLDDLATEVVPDLGPKL